MDLIFVIIFSDVIHWQPVPKTFSRDLVKKFSVQFTVSMQGFLTVLSDSPCVFAPSPAEAGRGGVHEEGHDPGDGPQLQGIQAQQAADAEGGAHDREAGEAAEAGAGEETPTETSGEPPAQRKHADAMPLNQLHPPHAQSISHFSATRTWKELRLLTYIIGRKDWSYVKEENVLKCFDVF